MADTHERRNHYRINDELMLDYRIVQKNSSDDADDSDETPEHERDIHTLSLNVVAAIADILPHSEQLLHRLSEHDPALYDELQQFNARLQLLDKLLHLQSNDNPCHKTQYVSLSAGGLAFHCSEPLQTDTEIELRIIVYPSYLTISAFARVIRFQRDNLVPGLPYWIAVEFTEMEPSDRRVLIKHILQKQSAQIREQRQL